jgi:hypothetical protein
MERASREVWAKRVERWQDSGLTAKEFAAELDVSPNSLTFWKWKLRQPNNAALPRSRRKREAKQTQAPASFLQLVPSTRTARHVDDESSARTQTRCTEIGGAQRWSERRDKSGRSVWSGGETAD